MTVGITKEQAAESREAIVSAADGLFGERGVEAVGLNELMGAAGPPRGGLLWISDSDSISLSLRVGVE